MKIRLALTDSMAGISYDPSQRPGISNLISIMAYLRNQENSCEELAHACNSLSLRDFKERVASTIIDDLSGIRARYEAIIRSDRADFLETIVAEGARKARKAAESRMVEVRRAIGL